MKHCHDACHPPPERPTLLLLQAALDLARQAITDQHPRLDYLPMVRDPRLPASEILAELVVARCAELDTWIDRYNSVLDHVHGPGDPPF